jgi:hypothetical protein
VADFNRVLRIEKGKAEVIRRPMPVPASGFVLVRQHIAPICIEHRAYETGFAEWFEDHLSRVGLRALLGLRAWPGRNTLHQSQRTS